MTKSSSFRTAAAAIALLLIALLAPGTPAGATPTPTPPPAAAPAQSGAAADEAATEPTFDDPTSTVTIPEVPGVEFLIGDEVVPAGPHQITVGYKGQTVTVTARGIDGVPDPTPAQWTHFFPEVYEAPAPEFDDGKFRVKPTSKKGVRYVVDGWNDGKPLSPGSWNDLSQLAGKTFTVHAEAVSDTALIFDGQTEWEHTFPVALSAPTFNDLASTVTIPSVDGVEYLIDDEIAVAGSHSFEVPYRGRDVTVTARGVNGSPTPTPQTWTHFFPEVYEAPAPEFDDSKFRVRPTSKQGVRYIVDGWNDGKPLSPGSWNDLSQFAGKTFTVRAEAVSDRALIFSGEFEWEHTFPVALPQPTYDDLNSTMVIPTVPGVEYLVDDQLVRSGPITYQVPYRGKEVKITARGANGSSTPAPQTWTHLFPEVVTPEAPQWMDVDTKVKAPSRLGVRYYAEGWNDGAPLAAGSWNPAPEFTGKNMVVRAVPVSDRTLLKGTTEWNHTFVFRPDYPLTGGDEFNGTGISRAWTVGHQVRSTKGKSVWRFENLSVHDGVLDVRISRHCLKVADEVVTDQNKTEGVCPPGTITRYSTGNVKSGTIYKAPKSVEVRVKLDADHHGIYSNGWTHSDEKFCGGAVSTSELAELDVMEVWGTDSAQSTTHVSCDNYRFHSTGVRVNAPMTGEWHTFRVEWDGYALRYLFDGRPMIGKAGQFVTADVLGIPQDRFVNAINDHMWQTVINVNAPVNGSWAPWIDDTKPFHERHDQYDYIRYEEFTPEACAPVGEIAKYRHSHPELGSQTGCEVAALSPGARVQQFENGRVYWSPATGAQVVKGAILQKYLASGGEETLGLPLAGELTGLRDGGVSQPFSKSTMFFSLATGAHFAKGEILKRYAAMGYENGVFGYPTSDEICGMTGGGCHQRFQRENGHIYWSWPTGAHSIQGAILGRYAAMGYERGVFGYPTTDEVCGIAGGGCYQRFQRENGHIYWTPATGAHSIQGQILARYGAMGYERSAIGHPTTDEICGLVGGGCHQRFQRENGHIYWSPRSGAWGVQGAIYAHYAANGWEWGRLGYPTGAEQCRNVPGAMECTQTFQRGKVTWNSRTGARG